MAAGTSSNKVKEISEILYKETILPAKEEAERIIDAARSHAAEIIHEARSSAKNIREKTASEMEDERKVYDSSIMLAVKQSVATLKGEVMTIFSKDLKSGFEKALKDEEVLKDFLKVIVDGINKEGIRSDLKLFVAKEVDFDALSKSVISSVQGKLEKGGEILPSGIALLIEDKKFTLKTTPETCMKIVSDHLSEVLKEKMFK
jgi:vacuolar-type H+-ATPase subunit E/Vma4